MIVVARLKLVPRGFAGPALLLEGSWPDPTVGQLALDDLFDARSAWIDDEAIRLATLLGDGWEPADLQHGLELDLTKRSACFLWLNALKLRYYLVRLLRLAALCRVPERVATGSTAALLAAMQKQTPWEFWHDPAQDSDYARLLETLAQAAGTRLRLHASAAQSLSASGLRAAQGVPPRELSCAAAGTLANGGGAAAELSPAHMVPGEWGEPTQRPSRFRLNRDYWRGTFGRCADRLCAASHARLGHDTGPVVMAGNRQLLGNVCRELLRHQAEVWWLYEKFCFGTAKEFFPRVRQIVCADWGSPSSLFSGVTLPREISFEGVSLSAPMQQWLSQAVQANGARQSRQLAAAMARFAQLRPRWLVCDEDATPMARIAVAAGRACGARSAVAQHGVPFVKFGFVPGAADQLFAWGPSSVEQFTRWKEPVGRLISAGCPKPVAGQGDTLRRPSLTQPTGDSRLRVLLLGTVPPLDHRPDSVAFHWTTRTAAAMQQACAQALRRLPMAEIWFKPHPRAKLSHASKWLALAMAESPLPVSPLPASPLLCRVIHNQALHTLWPQVDLAIACASSSGVEAAQAGVPTIMLLPQGSAEILKPDHWGLLGIARTADELTHLITNWQKTRRQTANAADAASALASAGAAHSPFVMARQGDWAASFIAWQLLMPGGREERGSARQSAAETRTATSSWDNRQEAVCPRY